MNPKIITVFALLFMAVFVESPPPPGGKTETPDGQPIPKDWYLPQECKLGILETLCTGPEGCCTKNCKNGKCAAGISKTLDCCKPKDQLPDVCRKTLLVDTCEKDDQCCSNSCKPKKFCGAAADKPPLDCCKKLVY